MGVPGSYVDVVYNGTDFDQLPLADRNRVLAELGIPRDRQIVGFIGRIQPAKGCYELMDSIATLVGRGAPVHLIFVGGVESMDAKGYAASVGISERVSFVGERFDVARLIDSFDLLALPSHRETFGVAALEAMARGKPVVASRVGGLPEVVLHEETGLLVQPGSEALADAIGCLLDNPRDALTMGKRGLEVARSKFSLDSMILRHEQIYASVLGQREIVPMAQKATVR